MTEQSLKLKICIPDGVMDEFCYPFLKALLKKLRALEKEDRIFENGIDKAQSISQQYNSDLTKIAHTVLGKMSQQLELPATGGSSDPQEIKKIINLAEEFLSIFEIK